MSPGLVTSAKNMLENTDNNNVRKDNVVASDNLNTFSDQNKNRGVDSKNIDTVIKVKSAIPRRRQDLLKWYGWGYKDSMFKITDGTTHFTGDRSITLLCVVAATCAAPASPVENLTLDNKDPTTHELLSSLGLKKLRIPAAHHRKRLAEQGRRHASGDSRMFVIKLPPNINYYSHADPAPAAARTLPLQMTSNGKPARVYHWNLPTLHKLAKNRPQARFDDDVVNVESTPTWPKMIQNHPNSIDALSYYVPAKKSSFRKYFSGNGKPKSFYVIDKDKKSAEYHRLLP